MNLILIISSYKKLYRKQPADCLITEYIFLKNQIRELKVLISVQCVGCLVLVVCVRRHQKYDHADYDQFAPNFRMAYKTSQRISVPNLKFLDK